MGTTLITEGVRISVSTQFRPDLSDLLHNRLFFNYKVDIQNHNAFKVQLMHRDWFIFDSLNEASFVSGEGVIGEQPILSPDQKYSYVSGCELNSEIGSMKGFYTFKNLITGELFQVQIPQFDLVYPGKLN
jgi:ApaG protein